MCTAPRGVSGVVCCMHGVVPGAWYDAEHDKVQTCRFSDPVRSVAGSLNDFVHPAAHVPRGAQPVASFSRQLASDRERQHPLPSFD